MLSKMWGYSMRLNLGCGNKLAKEAINVDINIPKEIELAYIPCVDKEMALEPDKVYFHQADIRRLVFVDDEVASEIHARHVIEHFYSFETQDLLKEWKRVLKPGGFIVLDQPCVIKCAINLLQTVTTGNDKVAETLGYRGFYGQPTPENTLMGHKQGFHYQSLAEELSKAGFGDFKEITPKIPSRDFCLVARKLK